jgi:hypothetical protein
MLVRLADGTQLHPDGESPATPPTAAHPARGACASLTRDAARLLVHLGVEDVPRGAAHVLALFFVTANEQRLLPAEPLELGGIVSCRAVARGRRPLLSK